MKAKNLITILILIALTILTGCTPKDSESVIFKDVKFESQKEEKEIKEIIELATSYLNSGRYNEAKEEFENAISKNTLNAEIYKKIEKIYMDKGRYDDAYYIINMAISNNVDVDNMKMILDDIKSKFEVITLNNSVYINEGFTLPQTVSFEVNGETIEKEVTWNNKDVYTSAVGTYSYEGYVEPYGRTVNQVLVVSEKPVDKYINKEFGFSLIFPDDWKGKYVILEDIEALTGNKGICVVYKNKKSSENYGFLFGIYEMNMEIENDEDYFLDSVYGALRYFKANGKDFIIGAGTGLGYMETEDDFNVYMKLLSESKDVINSIEEVNIR